MSDTTVTAHSPIVLALSALSTEQRRAAERYAKARAVRLSVLAADGADDLLVDALAALDRAAALGHGVARHCAAVIRGRVPEHVPIDDSVLLAEVDVLAAQGRGRSAIGIVARRHGVDPKQVAAIERRLRRKRRKTDTTGCPFRNL